MTTTLLWFRRDLRLSDNPALRAALKDANHLIPLYIHAPDEEAPWQPGAASHWWLHHSLGALDESLRKRGSKLLIAQGDSLAVLKHITEQAKVTRICWNRLPEPANQRRDQNLRETLTRLGIEVEEHEANRLIEGAPLMTGGGTPYRVFTPFWKAMQTHGFLQDRPSGAPKTLPSPPGNIATSSLDSLKLLPKIGWDQGFYDTWKPGEAAAQRRFKQFLQRAIEDYPEWRDRPDLLGTSRLSPHLHFGEIGPRQLLQGIAAHRDEISGRRGRGSDGTEWLRQLVWREFADYLLEHFPDTDQAPYDSRFRDFPWRDSDQAQEQLERWQKGQTGIPIVDAGMRELWHTGWMHNRVRMIVASLLTKNLGLHWLEGARWFWDTLVDADLANNSMGWQWCAGCGADAAPYFRIFNPVRQGERFDPQGEYIRYWVPEIAGLPDKKLNAPWETEKKLLSEAGIHLGKDYPMPIVDLAATRKSALERWERIR
ncbi:MAG: deoxyribodipyrimidine photo-lyase [Candidatus Thiodiazotropha sp.]